LTRRQVVFVPEIARKFTMHEPLVPRRVVVSLVATAIVLPIALCVVLGVAALLGQMGDAAGGHVLYRIALAGGILWVVDLVCLVLGLALGSLGRPE
jgi:hypothetical protein